VHLSHRSCSYSPAFGPAQQLRSFGIEVKADLPVGAGLVDHLAAALRFGTPRPFTQPRTTYWDAVLLADVTGAAGPSPDLMLWLVSLPTGIDPEPSESRSFTLQPQMTHPRSQGWVRLRSDSTDPPVINYGFFTDPEDGDLATLVKGLVLARRIAAQPALKEWVEEETAPGPSVVNESELRDYARARPYRLIIRWRRAGSAPSSTRNYASSASAGCASPMRACSPPLWASTRSSP